MKTIDLDSIDRLTSRAVGSERRRANLNLHRDLADPVQRFLNAVEPGSYVHPHRHADPERWELFVVLRGAAVILAFDGAGAVRSRIRLAAGGPEQGVEVPAGVWHTLAALEPGTVLLEVKPGPYQPVDDKDFAPWAPTESEPSGQAFEAWFRRARVGETAPQGLRSARGAG